ncbi:hypothetical protein DES52_11770 [Deinococcus yavapaiensis KR-236]|uniref:Beta-lactamase n=1 Tax=Deinococcus yavapaiensis KR-236 TaxID=694435 RepID=A0A318SHQ2_9DEIO|nr:hypothetical protein DES52_11770 [Deinococcus yavapaiensis KR-236]
MTPPSRNVRDPRSVTASGVQSSSVHALFSADSWNADSSPRVRVSSKAPPAFVRHVPCPVSLAAHSQSFGEQVRGALARLDAPGATVTLLTAESRAPYVSAGRADSHRALEEDARFLIYSVPKTLIAADLLTFVAEDRLLAASRPGRIWRSQQDPQSRLRRSRARPRRNARDSLLGFAGRHVRRVVHPLLPSRARSGQPPRNASGRDSPAHGRRDSREQRRCGHRRTRVARRGRTRS